MNFHMWSTYLSKTHALIQMNIWHFMLLFNTMLTRDQGENNTKDGGH